MPSDRQMYEAWKRVMADGGLDKFRAAALVAQSFQVTGWDVLAAIDRERKN